MPPAPDEVAKFAQLSRKFKLKAISRAVEATPHRSLRRRLAPQAIEDLVARYAAGEETPVLSREVGISESGLRDLLRTEGVSLRGHRMTTQDAEQAVLLYERGLTITQVAEQVGYSYVTIWKVIRKHGVATTSGDQGKRVQKDD